MIAELQHQFVMTAVLNEVGLKPNAVAGSPYESELVIYADDNVEMGIWEVTPGTFHGSKVGVCEFMHFAQGAGTITDESGAITHISPGVSVFVPDGWRGTWDVTSTVRKSYVVSRTAKEPRL